MTIPQLFSYVGWPLFGFSVILLVLHTINLLIPGVDFILPSSRMPIWPYLLGVPLSLLGLFCGIVGFFGEWMHEAWIAKQEGR